MLDISDFIKIGEIRKTHGVKGEMMLISNSPIVISDDSKWLFFNLEDCLVPFKLTTKRHTAESSVLFQCEDVDVVEEAAKFVGVEVFIPKAEYVADADINTPFSLVGFTVIEEENDNVLGTVLDFIESVHNPLLEIEHEGEPILLPFNEEFILGVDEDKLYVKLPEGLLDL